MYFQKTKINTDINPDEAIAYGAAVQGAILAGDKSEEVRPTMQHLLWPINLKMINLFI